MKKIDKNHREIICESCDANEDATMLQAFVSDRQLIIEDVDSIDEIDDATLRRLASINRIDCSIEGHCNPCDGPDDGNDRNQD
jgi:hypothetical protein